MTKTIAIVLVTLGVTTGAAHAARHPHNIATPKHTGAITIASFYGGGEKLNWHTASGEAFRSNGLTAAMPSRKMLGTRWKVTNLANRKSVVVRINDYGPHPRLRRGIDLTYGAMSRIVENPRKTGLVRVALQQVGR